MSNKNRKSIQFVPNSHAPQPESLKSSSIHHHHNEEYLDVVPLNELQQGELYIVKIKLIAIALFQGWDDDMCCFTILRTDLLEELRWSEARYLPNNFDAYLAFDYAGNPPIHLWTKQLRAVIPINWFNIFEEARHMQRQWHVSFWGRPEIEEVPMLEDEATVMREEEGPMTEEEQETGTKSYNSMDAPVPQQQQPADDEKFLSEESHNNDATEEEGYAQKNQVAPKEYKYYSLPPQTTKKMSNPNLFLPESPTDNNQVSQNSSSSDATTPAMRLQKQYNVTQQQQPKDDWKQNKQTTVAPIVVTTKSSPTVNIPEKRPEIKQRRSFSSFFLKKKKSKKSINEDSTKNDTKRKSAPPTPSINEKYNNTSKKSDHKQQQQKEVSPPPLTTSSSNSSTEPTSNTPDEVKTPKDKPSTISANDNKIELFDIESYFDMQATFAFLNSTSTDNFSLVDNNSTTLAN